MSLVVAYARDGVVYMGADTQSSIGTAIERFVNESGYKITRMPNGMLIGVCGRAKGHQMIVAQKDWFDVKPNEAFDKRYIVNKIIPRLSELMKGIPDDEGARSSCMSVRILIGWKDKIYYISKYFEVFECQGYASIGSGCDYSKYHLSQIGPNDDVNEGLLKALRTGARFESTVSAPYILIDTKDKRYTVVED